MCKCFGRGYVLTEVTKGAWSLEPCPCEFGDMAAEESKRTLQEVKEKWGFVK